MSTTCHLYDKGRVCGEPMLMTTQGAESVAYCPRCDGRSCPRCGMSSDPSNPDHHTDACRKDHR